MKLLSFVVYFTFVLVTRKIAVELFVLTVSHKSYFQQPGQVYCLRYHKLFVYLTSSMIWNTIGSYYLQQIILSSNFSPFEEVNENFWLPFNIIYSPQSRISQIIELQYDWMKVNAEGKCRRLFIEQYFPLCNSFLPLTYIINT